MKTYQQFQEDVNELIQGAVKGGSNQFLNSKSVKGEVNRLDNLKKYINAKPFDAGTFEDLSATRLRKAIREGDLETIQRFIPENISVEEYLNAFDQAPVNEGVDEDTEIIYVSVPPAQQELGFEEGEIYYIIHYNIWFPHCCFISFEHNKCFCIFFFFQ